MVAWTDTDIFAVNELMSYADLNTLAGNANYQHTPNQATVQGGSATYTLVGGTFGQDVDAAIYSLTITTRGGPVLATFRSTGNSGDHLSSMRLGVVCLDTVSFIGRNMFNTYGAEIVATTTRQHPVSIMQWLYGIPAGSHTFRLVWGVAGSGTATLNGGTQAFFSVVAL